MLCLCSLLLMSCTSKADEEPEVQGPPIEQEVKKEFNTPDGLHSEYMLVVDMQTGQEMYKKRAEDKIYPASMTKVMTCLVALMKYPDLDANVTVTGENVAGLQEANASIAGFIIGEEITIRDALYGLILPSGADAANVLSDNIDGGREAFIEDMNTLADNLNMDHTKFTNTTGLHEDEHYSSLNDLKKLMNFAWKFKAFRDIFSTPTYTTTPNNIHGEGLTVQSTRLLFGDAELGDGVIIGTKTGYTLEAGCCMISIAQIEGDSYMVISAYADGDPLNDHFHMEDAKAIYNQIAADYYGKEEQEPIIENEENTPDDPETNENIEGQGGSFGDAQKSKPKND